MAPSKPLAQPSSQAKVSALLARRCTVVGAIKFVSFTVAYECFLYLLPDLLAFHIWPVSLQLTVCLCVQEQVQNNAEIISKTPDSAPTKTLVSVPSVT